MPPDLVRSAEKFRFLLSPLFSFVVEERYGRRCLQKLSVTKLPRMFATVRSGAESTESPARRWCQRGIRRLQAEAVDAGAETYGRSEPVGSDSNGSLSEQGGAVLGRTGRGWRLAAG